MKKIVMIIIVMGGILALLIVLAGVFLDSLIKTGIETVGPEITGTAISLEGVDLSAISGKGKIRGFVLGNPKGFHTESALKVQEAHVHLQPKSLLSKTVVIEEIRIESPEFTFEGSLTGSNFTAIQKNIDAFVKAQGLQQQKENTEAETSETNVEIHHFIINDATVKISTTLLKGLSVPIPIPDIHLKNIGKESGGTSLSQVVSEVFHAIYTAIFKAVSGAGMILGDSLSDIGGAVKEGASNVFDGVKGLFGE